MHERAKKMIEIRPVSDLRNNFKEIEKAVQGGSPVYLTKNGYGAMVVMSLEAYSRLASTVDAALEYADFSAARDPRRLSHYEVFTKIRENLDEEQQL